MKFTIFGGEGFIGSCLEKYLEGRGHSVWVPSRDADETVGHDLGHVIYAIGLTADFRERLFDTVEAHVCKLAHLLRVSRFDSWLYLSSTRVYGGLTSLEMVNEDMAVPVIPGVDGLYDISKLMGEAICLSQSNEKIRVARLSNVYGYGQSKSTFLASIIDELSRFHSVVIRESPDSTKDYIALEDVLDLVEKIATSGQRRIYNVANGKAVSHRELATELTKLTGCPIRFEDNAPCRRFPQIDVSRITNEFNFEASDIKSYLSNLIT